jgi:hypothetical protein
MRSDPYFLDEHVTVRVKNGLAEHMRYVPSRADAGGCCV